MIFFAGKEKTEDLLDQAMSYLEKGQPKVAIPLFKKIVKQEPKNTTALYNQGLALNQLKKYQDAITCFDKVIEINPDDIGSINKMELSMEILIYASWEASPTPVAMNFTFQLEL